MKRIVDLSLTIDNAMAGAEVRVCKRLETEGWNATTLTLYSHCGTHMDAPRHFLPEGRGLDQLPLDACVGRARVVNLLPIEPRALIAPDDLGTAADLLAPGDRLLLRTDWYRRHGTSEWRDALPRVSAELAQWIVQRGIVLIGVEPPSVADVNNHAELVEVHEILLGGGVTIVEGLAHLDEVRQEVVELVALPLKIADGDGAPARVIAVEERDA